MTGNARAPEWAHRCCETLLRRWLAETHTPVRAGPLRLDIGPARVRTEVMHVSQMGTHRFGTIEFADSRNRAVATTDPGLLAAACSTAARERATPDAPINTAGGSLVDWVLRAATSGRTDPAPRPPRDLAVLARSISGPAEATRWLDGHLEGELVPALRELEPDADVEHATASLLTGRVLAVVGLLGACGVADEDELLRAVAVRLDDIAREHPGAAWLVRHWLTSRTLTDHAAVNGSELRYRPGTGELDAPPVRYEIPNPLLREVRAVPGVPVPGLGGEWSLRPVDPGGADVATVHRWMNTEHVAVRWRQAWSWTRWRDELVRQLDGAHSLPCLVARNGRDIAYVELYRVARDALARCYPHHPHDLGVHIAIGAPEETGRGQGSALLRAVAEGLLEADPRCVRVVAEPDVHNAASIAAFGKAGFAHEREVGLPGKNSALMVYSRRS